MAAMRRLSAEHLLRLMSSYDGSQQPSSSGNDTSPSLRLMPVSESEGVATSAMAAMQRVGVQMSRCSSEGGESFAFLASAASARTGSLADPDVLSGITLAGGTLGTSSGVQSALSNGDGSTGSTGDLQGQQGQQEQGQQQQQNQDQHAAGLPQGTATASNVGAGGDVGDVAAGTGADGAGRGADGGGTGTDGAARGADGGGAGDGDDMLQMRVPAAVAKAVAAGSSGAEVVAAASLGNMGSNSRDVAQEQPKHQQGQQQQQEQQEQQQVAALEQPHPNAPVGTRQHNIIKHDPQLNSSLPSMSALPRSAPDVTNPTLAMSTTDFKFPRCNIIVRNSYSMRPPSASDFGADEVHRQRVGQPLGLVASHAALSPSVLCAPVGSVVVVFMYVAGASSLLADVPKAMAAALRMFHDVITEQMARRWGGAWGWRC